MTSAAPQHYWDEMYVRQTGVYKPDRVLFKDVHKVCGIIHTAL
jgi:hypothetical protein